MTLAPVAPVHFSASEREREIALLGNVVQWTSSAKKRAEAMARLQQLGKGPAKTRHDDPPEPEAA